MHVKPYPSVPFAPKSALDSFAWFPDALTLVLVVSAVFLFAGIVVWVAYEMHDRARSRQSAAALANLHRPFAVRVVALDRNL